MFLIREHSSDMTRIVCSFPVKIQATCRYLDVSPESIVLKIGADGETRTLTILLSGDFESPASTIPPHRHAIGLARDQLPPAQGGVNPVLMVFIAYNWRAENVSQDSS